MHLPIPRAWSFTPPRDILLIASLSVRNYMSPPSRAAPAVDESLGEEGQEKKPGRGTEEATPCLFLMLLFRLHEKVASALSLV